MYALSILLGLLGLCVGSFISAFSYRWPKKIDFLWGRSFCPKCKAKISWYDNIPLFSYLVLRGKCRSCHKPISLRYPLLELTGALAFVGLGFALKNPSVWSYYLGVFLLPVFVALLSTLIAIFVIDLETQLIPDGLVFLLLGLVLLALFVFGKAPAFPLLAAGFGASFFLLLLAFVTRGRGMGLGDVKLALPLGAILGWPQVGVWLFLSFLTGGVFAILLLVAKKASFGKRIAFGPFLVLGFIITLFWGEKILKLFSL